MSFNQNLYTAFCGSAEIKEAAGTCSLLLSDAHHFECNISSLLSVFLSLFSLDQRLFYLLLCTLAPLSAGFLAF